jgi:hypothetical protein
MPKAARLVAALAFAALGYLAAEVFKNTMPERTVWGYFNPISAVIGLLCGWGIIGSWATLWAGAVRRQWDLACAPWVRPCFWW